MTVEGAVQMVQRAGAVRVENGKLKVQFHESERARLQPALVLLRNHREDVLRLLAEPPAVSSNAEGPGLAAPPGNRAGATAEPDPDDLVRASRVLADAGVRLMVLDGSFTVGIWSDLDSPALRDALRVFHSDGMPPVRYLDGAGIPPRFKLRSVPGDPVPLSVLNAMEQNPEEPWAVRDGMLSGARALPYSVWKAEHLNRLFAEHGSGGAGQITPATVADGIEKTAQRDYALEGPPRIEGANPGDSPEVLPREPAKPCFGREQERSTRRAAGQTVTFGSYEWIYNPGGITPATKQQIEELSAQGEGPLQVVQWPKGEIVFQDGKWKGSAAEEGRGAGLDRAEKEAKEEAEPKLFD
jgi:hypothetical protein